MSADLCRDGGGVPIVYALAIGTSASPGAEPITVPADAEGVVVFTRHYAGTGRVLSLSSDFAGTFTLDQDTGTERAAVAYARVTSTGSKNITPSWTGTISEGPIFFVAFAKGIPATGAWVNETFASALDSGTAQVSHAIASLVDSLVLACSTRWVASVPALQSGWTSIGTQVVNSEGGLLCVADSPGDPTTTATTQGSAETHGLAMISIISAAGGTVDLAANAAAVASASASLTVDPAGVLGSEIIALTATGTHGPGIMYPSLRSGDEGKRYKYTITSAPTNGTLDADIYGAFTYTGTSDTFDIELFEENISLGTVTITIAFGGVVDLASDAVAQAGATASLLKGVSLSAAGLAVAGASASASHVVPLAASAVAVAVAGGQLAVAVQLSAAALSTAAASAGLSVSKPLAADGAAQAGASADLSTNASVDLAANAQAVASSSAVLSLTVSFSAAAVGQAAASAALAKAVDLGADGAAQAGGAASLQVGDGVDLAAAATAQASAGASLWLDVPLGADALAQALAGGSLSLAVLLGADALASASGSGALAADVQLSAAGQVIATASAALQVTGPISAYLKGFLAHPPERTFTAVPPVRSFTASPPARI